MNIQCRNCKGTGISSVGTPCQVCDEKGNKALLPYDIGETVYYVKNNNMIRKSITESGKIIGYQIRKVKEELDIGVDFKQKGNVPLKFVSKDKNFIDAVVLKNNLRREIDYFDMNKVNAVYLLEILEKMNKKDAFIENITTHLKNKYELKESNLIDIDVFLSNYINEKNVEDVRLSRFLSLILRHKPQEVGLELDANGWINVNDLIAAINKTKRYINREILERIVSEDDKKRYSFDETKTKIRANQGHSVKVDVELKEVEPPQYLYHGTARKNICSINKKGILASSRLYVHLSADYDTAYTVGTRHGEPLVLKINAKEMYKAGYKFYLSENKVWLTTRVPTEFLI